MAHDFVKASKAKIREYEAAIASIKESLRLVGRAEAISLDGHPRNKPTTWKAADAIERILDRGAKTMKRAQLIAALVDQGLVGGATEKRRFQYAELAIDKGIEDGYLKEDRDTIIHWIPGMRTSRVRKRL
jgi:hypothetical protein